MAAMAADAATQAAAARPVTAAERVMAERVMAERLAAPMARVEACGAQLRPKAEEQMLRLHRRQALKLAFRRSV
jgi:hypothetical protein